MNLTEIIQTTQAGNLNSFNEIVLQYQDRLFNVALRMLGSEACAEDAVQNAFILALRGLVQFRGGSFDSWLLRILKNVCYDELRRQKRQATCTLEPWLHDDEEVETPYWLNDPSQNPTRQAETAELEQIVQNGLRRLSPDYRMALILVDLNGFDYAEAAQALRVPVGTVKSRLARARLRLRAILLDQSDLLPGDYTSYRLQARPALAAG